MQVVVSVWDALAIAAKTMTYAATLGAAGAVWFLRYCNARLSSAHRRRIRHIVLGLAALSVCGGAAQLLTSAGSMSGTAAGMLDESLLHLAWQAGAGRDNAIRAVGLLLAVVGALSDRPAWPALTGAALAATSFAWTGHARLLDAGVAPFLLGVHLLGAAFWLGALAPLLIVAGNGKGDVRRIAPVTARFGALALYVVALMTAAALYLLSMMLGGAAQLWSSGYGRIVMLKLGFVAVLLCLAAFNKLQLTPRLLAGDAAAVRRLRISLRLELTLGTLILGATAALTTIAAPPVLD
ncbi:MAG: CopD family protein [Gammaproteobacteria bacterium]